MKNLKPADLDKIWKGAKKENGKKTQKSCVPTYPLPTPCPPSIQKKEEKK